jgi:hypothetical protein
MEPASAGLGIAMVGVELGYTAFKLKNLWDQICEVPGDLRDLLSRLEHTARLLHDAEPSTASEGANAAILADCRRTHKKLEDMTKEIDSKLQRGGRWRQKAVAVRAITMKDIFEKCKSQLRDALETLSLALQFLNRYE